jgi:elongation factor G
MDRLGANLTRTIEMIQQRLRANPVLVQLPIGLENSFAGVIDLFTMQALHFSDELGAHPTIGPIPAELTDAATLAREQLVEKIAETDDELTLKYLSGETISNADLYSAMRKAVVANKMTPVLVGTSLRNKGVQPLLDAIVRYLPSPLDVPPVEGTNPKSGALTHRHARIDEPLSALVFKIVVDPYAGRLAYTRIYSGSLNAGAAIYNANRQRRERAQKLLQMQANKRTEIQECHAGDIVAIVGFKESTTGETLSDATEEIVLEAIDFPAPVIKVAIEPRSTADQEKLTEALAKLDEEDPTFRREVDPQTGQTVISGMGELHLEIITERLRREFGVQCRIGAPQVAYREGITRRTQVEERYIREIGGHHHYAVVTLDLAPNETNGGFAFTNRAPADKLPAPFVAAVERSVTNALQGGTLAGFPVIDLKVTLLDGVFHEMDSTPEDFEVAANMAFRSAMQKARPILLEPVMRVETYVPDEYVGSVVNDFGARRGAVQQMDVSGDGTRTIAAMTPLTEMIGYATALRSMTSGRGVFSMELDHYEQASDAIHERYLGPEWRRLYHS